MARSLNKAELIGNLTRDPELRYTPQGTAVCTFGLATNRQWTTDAGEKKEDVEFHRIVAWNKLGELCAQLLAKGRKVYVEGRIQTRKWTAQDGSEKTTTEIVINDMIILDSRGQGQAPATDDFDIPDELPTDVASPQASGDTKAIQSQAKPVKPKNEAKKEKAETDEVNDDDIPF